MASAIADFAAKQNAHYDAMGTSVDGIVADITFLNDTIAKLQSTQGQVTPEDQGLLDQLEARAAAAADKAAALDAMTDSAPPPPTA